MKVIYKYAVINGYKSIDDKTVKFDKAGSLLKGVNGIGKSTILSTPLWVVANRDYENNSNPIVKPLNGRTDTHRVDICMSIDGTDYIVSRIQTSKDNGSTSNSYEIDGVPKKAKEFSSWFEDFGITSDLFLALSNPNIFVSKSKDECRSILMEMGQVNIDDAISETDCIAELIAELSKSKLSIDDVAKKANADKKKVQSVHGKKGEITSTKISCLKDIKTALESKSGTKQAQAIVVDMLNECKELQIKYEQEIANNERLLFQIAKVNETRMRMIEDKINSHFKMVDFKFWETDTKGDLKPCCIAMMDGFELGSSMNTGREVLAKVDIINGLQKFYDISLPILLDNAECLSKDTLVKLESDSQLIMAVVTNDNKLKID